MTGEPHGDRDRSFALAQRVHELIATYGPSAAPRAYVVWYAYAAGETPRLNEAVKHLTADGRRLTEADIDRLYEAHIDGNRLVGAMQETGTTMLAEITGLMRTLDASLGSTAKYGASLRLLDQDLSAQGLNGQRLREIVASLVTATREVAADNQALEAQMRDSRREIETLQSTLEAARLESLTDPLTGLANRKRFVDTLASAVSGSPAASLIVLDIDRFKRFNDLYGHLTGDQVLRLVSAVMRETVDANAVLARFGGEEFAIVLPSSDRAAARAVAEKVRTTVMSRDLIKRASGESLGRVTVSLGIAVARPDDTPDSLLERADLCMFAAKRAGRNRIVDDTAPGILPRVA